MDTRPVSLKGTLLRSGLFILLSLILFSSGAWAQTGPPAPTGLAQVGSNNGLVNLFWNANPAATAYAISRQVYLTPTPTATGTLSITSTSTSTATGTLTLTPTLTPIAWVPYSQAAVPAQTPIFTDYQVTDGQNYLYSVWGMDSSNDMGLSSQVVAVPFTVPNFILPNVQNTHNSALDITWSLPLSTYPIVNYQVYRQYSTATPGTPIPLSQFFANPTQTPIVVTTATSYSDQNTPIPGATSVYYSVIAVDSNGYQGSEPSTQLSSVGNFPLNNLPPLAPILFGYVPALPTVTVTPTITPYYGVQLVWNGPLQSENVTSYQVFSNSTPIATVLVPAIVTPTMMYLDTPVPVSSGGQPVTYSLVANNANGSVTSNTITQSIVRPSMGTGLQLTPNPSGSSMTISWSSGTGGTYGLTGYNVYEDDNGPPGTPYPATPGAGTPVFTSTPTPFAVIMEIPTITPTTLTVFNSANVNHTYWVQPIYRFLNGGSPTTLVGDTVTNNPHLAPTPVTTVLVNSISGNNKVNVSWNSAAPGYYGTITNYVIYASVNSVTPTPIATVSASRSVKNTYVSSISGTAVYFVGAEDSVGNISDLSAFSTPVTLSALLAPQTPQVIPAIQNGTTMTYSWLLNPASDNVTGYSVYGPDYLSILSPANTPTPVYVTVATAVPFPTQAPANGSVSLYYVVAQNAVGASQPATMQAYGSGAINVNAVAVAQTAVAVSWNMTPVAGMDSIVVYRTSATPGPAPYIGFRPITIIPSSNNSYSDSSVTPGINYSYMVTGATTSAGTPVAQSPISIAGGTYGSVLTWPNAPSGVSIVSGSNSTTITWKSNPTPDLVSSYAVSLTNGSVIATVVPPAALKFVVTAVPALSTSFQIFASNSGGTGSATSISALALPQITPTVVVATPGWFTPTTTVTPGVWISGLSYPASVVDYSIYRSTDPTYSADPTPIAILTSPVSYYQDTGYTPGSINYYRLVADNGAGVTATFSLSGLLGVDLWPGVPANVNASGGTTFTTLNWSAPSGGNVPVTAYGVSRALTPGAEVPYASVTTHGGSYVDTVVTPGISYFYTMNSIGGGLPSQPSNEVGAVPGPSVALSGSAGVSQGILNWSPATQALTPGFSAYVVQRIAIATPAAATAIATFVVPTATITTYTDNTTGYNTGYVYQVAPLELIGVVPPGEYLTVTPTPVTVVGAYSNPVTMIVPPQGPATLNAVSGDQLAQLRWSYQGAVALSNYTYTIQRKLGTAPISAFQTIATGVTGLDYTDSGLLDKTLYNYQILAIAAGTTMIGYSPIANALPAKPPVVDNAAVSLSQTQSGNSLYWSAANGQPGDFNSATMYPLGGYHIYRSSDGGGSYQLLNPSGTTSTNYTDTNVSVINGSSYTYLVRAFDAPPGVSVTDENMVHETPYNIVVANGLTASTALDRNSIRPFRNNPGDSPVVNIRFVVTTPGVVTIKVYSLSGTFIKQLISQFFGIGIYGVGGNTPLQWDGRNANGDMVASGVYLITTEMSGDHHQEIEKIAVIK